MKKMTQVLLGLLLVFVCVCKATLLQSTWEMLHSPTALPSGTQTQPSIRYSHTAVVYQDQMILSHGYFYDADNHKPRWLSDTWAMSLRAPYFWRQLVPHLDRQEALEAYGRGSTPVAPCGRYGATAVVKADSLYLFGGTDGGFHKHGRDGFEQGHDFDELWELNLKTSQWKLLGNGASPNQPWPAARHLHGAVVIQGKMLVHGGVGKGFADVWAWDLKKRTWKQLTKSADSGTVDGPGSLFAAGYIPIDCHNKQGFLVFGGRPEHGAHEELSKDVWFFDHMRYKWSALTLTQSSQVPSGRFYLGLAALDANDNVCSMDLKTTIKKKSQEHAPMAFATGASVHTPTMECSDESWTLSWDLDRMLVKWDPQTPLPFGFYHNTLVAWNDTVFTFGGHLCGDTQGHLPYRYLNTVQALTVPAVIAKDLPTQSAASLSSNGKNRGAQTQGLHLASAGSLDRELKSLRSS